MFNNIGRKIKTLAKVICWIEIIACVITGFVLMALDKRLILGGILIALGGSVLSWLSSFLLYGFGQLVENSDELVDQNDKIISQNAKLINNNADKQNHDTTLPNSTNVKPLSDSPESQQERECASCGKMISSNPCPYCGSSNFAKKLATSNPDKIICSLCGVEQLSNRTCCWHCSAKFYNSNQ